MTQKEDKEILIDMEKMEYIQNLTFNRRYFEINVDNKNRLDFNELFGNFNEVYLEIGSGRGEFLIKQAENNSDINFLGIDLKEKRIKSILMKLNKSLHTNVKITRLYVDTNVTNWIPPDSIAKIYIIHPDPWPKRKHYHRRLIQSKFLDALYKILKENGIVQISTDHRGYAKWIQNIFEERNDYIPLWEDGFSYIAPNDHVETFFEQKKKKEGYPPIFLSYKKVRNNDRS